jgi:hypothetical protein
MRRMRRLLIGLLAGLLLTSAAMAQAPRWAPFQAAGGSGSGPPPPPTIAIDGGPTYFTSNLLTTAAAPMTFCNSGATPPCNSSTGTVYGTGWDSPNFFSIGWWSEFIATQSDADFWTANKTNTAFFCACGAGQLDLYLNNGISFIVAFSALGQITSVNGRSPGAETVGMFTADEPHQWESGWTWPVQGYPAVTYTASASSPFASWTGTIPGSTPLLSCYNCGGPSTYLNPATSYPYQNGSGIPVDTVWYQDFNGPSTPGAGTNGGMVEGVGASWASTTVTQKAAVAAPASFQDTRFNWVNFTNGWTALHVIGSATNANLPATTVMAQTVQAHAPSSVIRHVDWSGIDLYFFVESRGAYQLSTITNTYAAGLQNQALLTQLQAAKGTHYGDLIDIERSFQVSSASPTGTPLVNFIEGGLNCLCSIPYDIQAVEMQWADWGAIIHGQRAIGYFGQAGGDSPSGCTGGQFGDALYCGYTNTSQVVTTTSASISGNTLSVTASPTGNGQFGAGLLAPGMRSTSGVTGAPVTIVAQTQAGTNGGTPAMFDAVFSGTNNTTMTVSNVRGTITAPSVLYGWLVEGQGCNPTACPAGNGQYIRIVSGAGSTWQITDNAAGANHPNTTAYPVATFDATFSGTNSVNMTVSNVSGNIDIPSQLFAENLCHANLYQGPIMQVRANQGGGVYTVDAPAGCNPYTPGPAPYDKIYALPDYGSVGTYTISGGGTGSGAMTFQQYGWGGCSGCGYGPSSGSPIGTLPAMAFTNGLIASLAPVINAPFAKNVLTAQSPDRYVFDRGFNGQNCGTGSNTQTIQSAVCGTASGLDSMVKYYTGSTYIATTGDTIAPGLYLFATTANPMTDINIPASFTLNGGSGCGVTTADVIGEGRSRPIGSCNFTDTFANAWTTHIYKLH